MKILVVDDTRIIVSVVEAILVQEGHTVFTAADGREGYLAFGNMRPEMVVTDIEMPWRDGLSMVAAIRRIQPDIGVLYMTGNPGPYQRRLEEERERWGAGLLSKPFIRSELLRSLGDVVAQARPTPSACADPLSAALSREMVSRPTKPDVASLSSAHFQREDRYEIGHRDVAGGLFDDGIRAGVRG